MRNIFMASLLLIIFLIGCDKQLLPASQGQYPITIAWNDLSYGISVEEVSKNNLGKLLGEVKRQIKPMPLENGDANYISVGSKIFEIRGIDIKDAVAVEKDGKINKAIKNGPLK